MSTFCRFKQEMDEFVHICCRACPLTCGTETAAINLARERPTEVMPSVLLNFVNPLEVGLTILKFFHLVSLIRCISVSTSKPRQVDVQYRFRRLFLPPFLPCGSYCCPRFVRHSLHVPGFTWRSPDSPQPNYIKGSCRFSNANTMICFTDHSGQGVAQIAIVTYFATWKYSYAHEHIKNIHSLFIGRSQRSTPITNSRTKLSTHIVFEKWSIKLGNKEVQD